MVTKTKAIAFSPELLRDYSRAALDNATELIAEASLLHKHGHFARAYFLAIAAIEETGKAFLAFEAQGRNLSDSSVVSKFSRFVLEHPDKITFALLPLIFASTNVRESIMAALDLIVTLKDGREPSMYTDLRSDTSTIQIPKTLVRKKAAFDCLRLARDCLLATREYVSGKPPRQKSVAEDQLFTMKSKQHREILSNVDFWWYWIDELKMDRKDYAEAIISYRQKYAGKGLLHRKPGTEK
jgi:AbiV family abortive infection protein